MGQVVIVGAGVAGLATAIRLADFGHQATVLERDSDPGGRLRTLTDAEFRITLPATLRDLFAKTGRRLDLELALHPAEPTARYVTSMGTVEFPHASRGGTLDALRAPFGDVAADDWDRLMRRAADIWELTRPVLVDRAPTRRSIAALARRPSTRRAAFSTLGELVTDLDLTHPAILEILAAHAHAAGVDPVTGPAIVATRSYLEQTFGLWTVEGGPGALVEALVRRATERGAVIHPDTTAADLGSERRRVVAVHTEDGTTYPADVVVCAASDAGGPVQDRWALLRRPPHRTGIRGLYRVGETTHPGPGVHGVVQSAAMVADLIGRAALR